VRTFIFFLNSPTASSVVQCLSQGKVEMELELIGEEEAKQRPVGRARDEPNQHPTLDPPKYETRFTSISMDFTVRQHLVLL
jgi:hypothetical protein